VAALQTREEVLEAYLFGSWANGRQQRHSDVDVAVYVDPQGIGDTPFGYDSELTAGLMSALGTDRIDLVVLNRAPPVLYHRVLREGTRLLSRNLSSTTTREALALSRYYDYLPQLDKIESAMRQDGGEAPQR
jgi:hypothetical protein